MIERLYLSKNQIPINRCQFMKRSMLFDANFDKLLNFYGS